MHILYVRSGGPAETSEPDVLAQSEDIEVCSDETACVARLRELSESETPATLVVIGRGAPRPLSTARTLQASGPHVHLAIVAPADDAPSLRQKLALSPDISGTAVITGTRDDLVPQIRQLAEQAQNERQVEGALEQMNLELRQQDLDRRSLAPQRSVSDRHLSALTRHAPDAIISVDTAGSVASWNQAATDIFGYDAEQSEGAALSDLLSPAGQTELQEMVQRAADGSAQEARDLQLCRADSSTVTAAVTAAPVRDDHDRVVGVVVMARDVTQQRRTEEQLRHLQQAESLATLAGGVAHDFNNLLVSVQGWSELALEEPEDRELTRQALEQIHKSAGQAAGLARQMLAYSGRTDLAFKTVQLNEIVDDMADLLRSSISKKIELRTTLDTSLPPVRADPTQLRQVILNLVTNAAEALGDDPGRIDIRTSTRRDDDRTAWQPSPQPERDGQHIILSIADTGPGMDAATVERIFEPFYTTKFAGRGLGLAASLGIARAHGGTIEVETEPGAGTQFHVVLPTEPPAQVATDDPDRSS